MSSWRESGLNSSGNSFPVWRASAFSQTLETASTSSIETVRAAASAWGVSVEIAEIRQRTDIDAALDALAATKPDAILLASDTLLLSERTKIVEFMAFRRIPAIYPFREYAEGGGLIAHGANIPLFFERAASYVDRILKGTK